MVIALCSAMMVAEIIGGSLFGPLALVVGGLHMSTQSPSTGKTINRLPPPRP